MIILIILSLDCFCAFGLLSFFTLPYTVCLHVFFLKRVGTLSLKLPKIFYIVSKIKLINLSYQVFNYFFFSIFFIFLTWLFFCYVLPNNKNKNLRFVKTKMFYSNQSKCHLVIYVILSNLINAYITCITHITPIINIAHINYITCTNLHKSYKLNNSFDNVNFLIYKKPIKHFIYNFFSGYKNHKKMLSKTQSRIFYVYLFKNGLIFENLSWCDSIFPQFNATVVTY